MGVTCPRRRNLATAEEENSIEDWLLISLPEVIQENIIDFASPAQPAGVTTPISRTRGYWIRLVLKIRLIKQFCIRRSRTGSWLNLYPEDRFLKHCEKRQPGRGQAKAGAF